MGYTYLYLFTASAYACSMGGSQIWLEGGGSEEQADDDVAGQAEAHHLFDARGVLLAPILADKNTAAHGGAIAN